MRQRALQLPLETPAQTLWETSPFNQHRSLRRLCYSADWTGFACRLEDCGTWSEDIKSRQDFQTEALISSFTVNFVAVPDFVSANPHRRNSTNITTTPFDSRDGGNVNLAYVDRRPISRMTEIFRPINGFVTFSTVDVFLVTVTTCGRFRWSRDVY